MTLRDWQTKRWLHTHRTSPEEAATLLALVDRDLAVSRTPGLNPDWRFNIAYNAALQAATLALAAAGYRAAGNGHHYYTLQSLAHTVGADEGLVLRLDVARRKRNRDIYERAGLVSHAEADEMRALAEEVRELVLGWLRAEHPELV